MKFYIGQRVRWKSDSKVGLSGDGVVVSQPIGAAIYAAVGSAVNATNMAISSTHNEVIQVTP